MSFIPYLLENSSNTEVIRLDKLLELNKITKRFGAVQALDGADFHIDEGEVVGLVGDNGAGKSTLMKVISGVYIPDSGTYVFKGKEQEIRSPRDASKLGIEMVFQDFALLDNLDVKSNIFLGRELYRSFLGILRVVDRKKMAEKSREIIKERLNLDISSMDDLVKNLSGGQRQGVAIGRAILFEPKLLILDEPTASLSVDKIKNVLELIHRLQDVGFSVILISHRLQEIMEVCDRVSVMYRGKIIAELDTKNTNIQEIVTYMVGGDVAVY